MVGPGSQIVGLGAPNGAQTPSTRAHSTHEYAVRYKVGTVNLDIVDGERMQLIWEGVAEGRITREDMTNPRVTIDAVVAELFQRYSGVAKNDT